MKLTDVLTPAAVYVPLQCEDKSVAFRLLVDRMAQAGVIPDAGAALAALEEREAVMSTGLGGGLGLPHGRVANLGCPVTAALGVCPDGIEYEALDDEPVFVLVAVFSDTAQPDAHLAILAGVSAVFTTPGVIEDLCAAATPEAVLDRIRAAEDG